MDHDDARLHLLQRAEPPSTSPRGRSVRAALLAVIAACLAAGCDNGEKERAKLAEVQKQADERIAQVQREAADKVATLEKKMEQMQSDMADAGSQIKAEAEE